jgi:hypothetical protein
MLIFDRRSQKDRRVNGRVLAELTVLHALDITDVGSPLTLETARFCSIS